MKTLAVGELKARFSEVLQDIRMGQPVAIGFGKQKTKVAVILPYSQYVARSRRRLGILSGGVKVEFHEDFKITDEEFLQP